MVTVTENGRVLHPRGYGRVQPYRRRRLGGGVVAKLNPLYWLNRGAQDGQKAAHWLLKKQQGKNFSNDAWNSASRGMGQLMSGDFSGFASTAYNSPRGQRIRSWFNNSLSNHSRRLRGSKMDISELEEGPGPVSRPSSRMDISSRSQIKMGGKRTYTSGNHGGRFGGKRMRKLSKSLYRGVMFKSEGSNNVSDTNCVYAGVNSHPLIKTLQAFGQSITRLLAKKWHQDPHSMSELVNSTSSVAGTCSIRCTITFRRLQTEALQDIQFTTGGITWADLGDNIVHHLMDIIATSTVYFEVVRLKFANIDATAVESLQTVVFHCKDLYISIYGKGIMKVQNLTVGASGEAEVDAQADDIANNPIRGKVYTGIGQSHRFHLNNDITGITNLTTIFYGTDGAAYTGASDANLNSDVQNMLAKPPHHKAISGFQYSQYVRLAPGEIKNLVVQKTYSMSFNQWLRRLMPVFRSGTAVQNVVVPQCIRFGQSKVVGLEHELKLSGEADIKIGFQYDHTVTGIATYKHRVCIAPVLNPSVATKIVAV